MKLSDREIANAVQARLAQLGKNSNLPFVLMPLDPETFDSPGDAGPSRSE